MCNRWSKGLVCLAMASLVGLPPAGIGAQPEEPAAQAPEVERFAERAAELARRMGWEDLVERLRSEDPQVRQEALTEFRERMVQQGRRARERFRLERLPEEAPRWPFRGWEGAPEMVARLLPGLLGGQRESVALAVHDNFLFVLRGNTLYQFDPQTLRPLRQVVLEPAATQRQPSLKVEMVKLAHADPNTLAELLEDTFAEGPAVPALHVVPVPQTHSLILRGTANDLRQAEMLIRQLDVPELVER